MEREHPKVIDTNLHSQDPPTNITPGMRWNSRMTVFLAGTNLKILINQV